MVNKKMFRVVLFILLILILIIPFISAFSLNDFILRLRSVTGDVVSSPSLTVFVSKDVYEMSTSNPSGGIILYWHNGSYERRFDVNSGIAYGYLSKSNIFTEYSYINDQERPLILALNSGNIYESQSITISTDKGTVNIDLPYLGKLNTVLYFYVANDGALYYLDRNHNGHYSTESSYDLLTPTEALVREHLLKAKCTDSDGGEDYYVKGITKGPNPYSDGDYTTSTDYCMKDSYSEDYYQDVLAE